MGRVFRRWSTSEKFSWKKRLSRRARKKRLGNDTNMQQVENLDADPEYKRFGSYIDKVLSTFDSIQEWQDMIAFLTKLIKTLQSFQKFTVIPRKLLVAKRLAQTLNPALPAGVHSKSLEAYAMICKISGVSTFDMAKLHNLNQPL